MNEFDRVAKYYDRLARLVFGTAMLNSQLHFLSRIPKSGKVLIMGGGTGWWLAKFIDQNKDLEIWFVDASKQMIDRARARVAPGLHIHFIHGTSNDLHDVQEFDAVIAYYFLDVFDQQNLKAEIIRIKALAKSGALWLVTDFVNVKWWHALMLTLMYRFFGLVANLTTRELPDWQNELLNSGLVEIQNRYFYSGFIKALLYRTP